MILTENKKRYDSPLSEVLVFRMETILNNGSDTTPITPGDEETPE